MIHDNASFKFSRMIAEYWQAKGHEILMEMGANPIIGGGCDLVYTDFLDNNIYCYLNGPKGDRFPSYPKKRIAVRMIDIDIWQGRHCDPALWDYLDDAIVINKFYYDKVKKESNTPEEIVNKKLHLIYPGVDLNKFTFRKKERGYKIAMIVGNLWEAKSTYEAIRIFQEVNRAYPGKPWELHIRGEYIPPEWHRISYEHLIEISGLKDKITIYPPQPDMSDWLQDKDYILVVSHKEAFSYAAAEGMAVGLKPVLNNFFGSEWSPKYRFNSIYEAVTQIGEGEFNQEEYRQYIQDNYDLKRMLRQYDELFGT